MLTLSDIDGTAWAGDAELWLDPLGNEAQTSACTLRLDGQTLHYTWVYEGTPHEGSITLRDDGAVFVDSFHATEPMTFRRLPDAWGLFQVAGEYGPDADWGWRIGLTHRTPTDELVLQMTNITPWGEEARAVRMVGRRA